MNALFSVVSKKASRKKPYPYVYIERDGCYRELKKNERAYLEEEFHPADGGRPYIKYSYQQKAVDENISGFLERKLLPDNAKRFYKKRKTR